jgi:hypothetical protein
MNIVGRCVSVTGSGIGAALARTAVAPIRH